eukprot:CAMPEP_0206824110 /NCGR_PEP_ID=MMETSP0975-20121206/13662_1 /ASSEMBLY_ACC=CAM_ASM_000399 /TAXON_ID=483370 /ORGANISM="non described non described, Strain CCMP2097" /LENGTH=1608 /DNA_ID=CAMNT_0054366369 /DNA_START=1 /DNA_END=4825 /DNA_ORIENTATION=-
MSAPWPTTALAPLLEASEFFAQESPMQFWRLVDSLYTPNGADGAATAAKFAAASTMPYSSEAHEEVSAMVLDAGEKLLSPLGHSLLQLALATREYAPRVEAHRSVARGAAVCANGPLGTRAVVHAGAEASVVCAPEDLAAAIASCVANEGAATLVGLETWYPCSSSESAPAIELIGTLGSSDLQAWHAAASSLADAGLARYTLRHAADAPAGPPTFLQGFGANLDIKNMEYRNFDTDSKAALASETPAVVDFEVGAETAGVVFSTLLQRRPELQAELWTLREALLEEASADSSSLKMWRLHDLSLQAAAAVLGAPDALKRLAEVTQDFPSHASAISALAVPDAVRLASANAERRGMQASMTGGAAAPRSVVFIGGRAHQIDSATFSIFDLVQSVRLEAASLDALQRLVVSGVVTDAPALLRAADSAPAASASEAARVDVLTGSKAAVVYVNNMEKDKDYARWQRSVQALLYPSYQLHAISKNLYTCVVVVDASTAAGLGALRIAYLMINQGYPVRFGFVLAGTQASAAQSSQSADVDDSAFVRQEADPLQKLFLAKAPAAEDAPKSESAGDEVNQAALMAYASSPPAASEDEAQPLTGRHCATLFALAKAAKGPKTAFAVLALLAEGYAEAGVVPTLGEGVAAYALSLRKDSGVHLSGLETAMQKGFSDKPKEAKAEAWKALTASEGFLGTWAAADYELEASQFVASKGLKVGSFAMNGLVVDSLDLQSELLPLLTMEQQRLAGLVSTGKLTDRTKSVYGKALLGAAKTRAEATHLANKHSQLPGHEAVYVDLSTAEVAEVLGPAQGGAVWMAGEFGEDDDSSLVSVVVLADLGTARGIALAAISLRSAATPGGAARVAIFHNPADASSPASRRGFARSREMDAAARPGGDSAGAALAVLQASLVALRAGDVASATEDAVAASAAARALGVSAGDAALIVNGRRVDVPLGSELLDEATFAGVVFHEEKRAGVVSAALDLTDDLDVVMLAAAFMGCRAAAGERTDVDVIVEELVGQISPLVSFSEAAEGGTVRDLLSVTAILDPLTEAAQRAAPVLLVLRDALQLNVRLVLLPNPEVREMPLQKYYRFALNTHAVGSPASTPSARFDSLPKGHVLTLRVDTPEAWDVQTAAADSDLDNLRCDDGRCETTESISYQLKSLTVSGQCFDARDRRPPNGLQLELRRVNDAGDGGDTLVMQNLGYFQLRASPGAWALSLANGTKSNELYDVLDGGEAPKSDAARRRAYAPDADADATPALRVLVADFSGATTVMAVRKKPQFQDVDLLDSLDDVGKISGEAKAPSMLGRLWGGNKVAKKAVDGNETIHVFSLATGALYERMLKIMMLSVRKRTSGPVKFWLFENYLTPAFKDDASKLAAAKGFEVAYVTYKWPEWLRRQTDKQRIIWGYKILFLDVLFPLSVPKIIYVDADQIVRGDLRELWAEDLQGKPYGYVPFCDSRPETLGYQFWRSGYWKDHLGSKPYHISALYVVDLHAFRRMAVGDQLRAVYDQLSRDPNSLANLDQDLPNYAQNSIPIHSLPQEWLWCESWCSDETKAAAKTIDLCNNPQHKENKLSMAKRIINGSLFQESWVDLDDEVKAATERYAILIQASTQ